MPAVNTKSDIVSKPHWDTAGIAPEQSGPGKPLSQSQVFGPIQVPLPEQSLTPEQLKVKQSAPSHPNSHSQVSGAMQVPLPEQSLTPVHVGVEQSAPAAQRNPM